jgi:hypothetical protein
MKVMATYGGAAATPVAATPGRDGQQPATVELTHKPLAGGAAEEPVRGAFSGGRPRRVALSSVPEVRMNAGGFGRGSRPRLSLRWRRVALIGRRDDDRTRAPLLRYFTGNIGYHHVHHLSARIPNYNLRRAHEELDLFRAVPTLTIADGMRATRLKLWDEQRGRLVTFAEGRARAWCRPPPLSARGPGDGAVGEETGADVPAPVRWTSSLANVSAHAPRAWVARNRCPRSSPGRRPRWPATWRRRWWGSRRRLRRSPLS